MKKIIAMLLLAAFGWQTGVIAQQQTNRLVRQAQRSHARNEYKEAFEQLRNAEQALNDDERAKNKKMPEVRYTIAKERLNMYIKLRNAKRASDQLIRMEELAKAANIDSLNNDLLYMTANNAFTFGKNSEGDKAINELIGKYKINKQYEKVNECYKTLIDIARRAGNATLTARAYDKFIIWNDSLKALNAQDELNELQRKYDESLSIIEEKETSISTKQFIIVGLCALAAILGGALALGIVILLRYILLTRKQKKTIQIANEHNQLKNEFIRNISTQMEPTLNTLDATQPGVQALRTFTAHIQELSDLENTLTEPYELQEINVSTFCEQVMEQIKGKVAEDVTLTVNAPKLTAKICPEQLERLLLHLLENAATYTPAGGKIWIDFKKRGAHTHQFVISDTGCGIAEELREDLFKPFTETKDLAEGDGLGLPICALIATKMNGSLTLDTGYTRGTRFVLELHT